MRERVKEEMETQSNKIPVIAVAALLAVLVLGSLACTIGGLTLDKNAATIDINLTQDQINTIIQKAAAENTDTANQLLDSITGVELHDGFVRLLGTTKGSDGSEVNGSYATSFTAENDMLKAQIIAVNIPGVTLTDPRIAQMNQQMADALSKSVTESNGKMLFKEATVKEGSFHLKIQVNLQTK
jgi:hypothetical protein